MKKVIIFDLDGTLYSRNNKFFNYLELKTQQYMMKNNNLTLKQFQKMEKELPSLLDALKFLNISKDTFYKDVYDDIVYEVFFEKDTKLISLLKQINSNNIIVTMSADREIYEVSRLLGIRQYIEKGYSPEKEEFTSKKEIYYKILNDYGINPENVIVIGDNYKTDIEPAIELKMTTILISRKTINCKANYIVKDIYEALNLVKK